MNLRAMIAASFLALVATSRGEVAGTTCDGDPWAGSSIHAATTTVGHVVALLGPDKQIRVNEWNETSQTWSGWVALPPLWNETHGEPWIQARVMGFNPCPPSPWETHNIFARSESGKIIQWTITIDRTTGRVYASDAKVIPGGEQAQGRLASGETGFSGPERQKLFAIFADGTIRSRSWSGAAWSDWLYEGLGGLVGSPWVTQLPGGRINLFVRTTRGLVWQRSWNGAAWSVWVQVNPLGSASGRVHSDPAAIYAAKLGHRLFAKTDLQEASGCGCSPYGGFAQSSYAVNSWTDWSEVAWSKAAYLPSIVPVVSGSRVAFYGIESGRYLWATHDKGLLSCMR